MEKGKHTPGPWHVYKGSGLYVDSGTAGSVCKIADKRISEQQQANGRLIAAAPELLEALEQAAAAYELLIVSGLNFSADERAAMEKDLVLFESAIRKATEGE